MDIRKFIESEGALFNWSEVESRSGVPDSSLRSFVSKRRGLSDTNFKKIQSFFLRYNVDLEYNRTKPTRKKAIAVGDIVPTTGWVHLLGRIYKRGGMRGLLEGGKIRVTFV